MYVDDSVTSQEDWMTSRMLNMMSLGQNDRQIIPDTLLNFRRIHVLKVELLWYQQPNTFLFVYYNCCLIFFRRMDCQGETMLSFASKSVTLQFGSSVCVCEVLSQMSYNSCNLKNTKNKPLKFVIAILDKNFNCNSQQHYAFCAHGKTIFSNA